MARRIGLFVFLTAAVGLSLYAAFGPDVVEPSGPWDPPPRPTWEGPLAENELLQRARPVARGQVVGPETVAFDHRGRIVTGLADGRIVRIDPSTDRVETIVRTGTSAAGCGDEHFEPVCGRPLGIEVLPDGSLVVADAVRGLLAVSTSSTVRVLTSIAKGVPLKFTDDLAVAKDGRVYFTDASTKWDRVHYREDVVENEPWGRLLRYDPKTRETEVLLEKLYFANGVVLSEAEDFVVVAETSRYRLRRYWISGPKAGTDEVFVDALPGLPDNLRRASDGGYWVSLGAKRSVLVDLMHPRPALKKIVAKLIPLKTFQETFIPKIGLVAKLDPSGKIERLLWDTTGESIRQISHVVEHDGRLWFGSIAHDRIAVLDLKDL
ncbi:SMP-30/gluconolactonase/LRE family protein [Myxococcota bacterium]|nr:SMP-30/gluconolactonase/LRE family protein [Myxococcota bacterium]